MDEVDEKSSCLITKNQLTEVKSDSKTASDDHSSTNIQNKIIPKNKILSKNKFLTKQSIITLILAVLGFSTSLYFRLDLQHQKPIEHFQICDDSFSNEFILTDTLLEIEELARSKLTNLAKFIENTIESGILYDLKLDRYASLFPFGYFLRELEASIRVFESHIKFEEMADLIKNTGKGELSCRRFQHDYEYRRDLKIETGGEICNEHVVVLSNSTETGITYQHKFDIKHVQMEFVWIDPEELYGKDSAKVSNWTLAVSERLLIDDITNLALFLSVEDFSGKTDYNKIEKYIQALERNLNSVHKLKEQSFKAAKQAMLETKSKPKLTTFTINHLQNKIRFDPLANLRKTMRVSNFFQGSAHQNPSLNTFFGENQVYSSDSNCFQYKLQSGKFTIRLPRMIKPKDQPYFVRRFPVMHQSYPPRKM